MPDDKGAQGGQPPAQQSGQPTNDKGAQAAESKGGAAPAAAKRNLRTPTQVVQLMNPKDVEIAMKSQFNAEIVQKLVPIKDAIVAYVKMQEESHSAQMELVQQQRKFLKYAKVFGLILLVVLLVIILQGVYVTHTVSKYITNNSVTAVLDQRMKEFTDAVKTLKEATLANSKKMADSYSKLERYYSDAKGAIERNQEARLAIEKARRASMASYSSQAVTSARVPAEDTREKTVKIVNTNSNGKEIQVYGLLAGGKKKFVVAIPAGFSSTVPYEDHYGVRFLAKIKGEELESISPEFSEGRWSWDVDGVSREGVATKL